MKALDARVLHHLTMASKYEKGGGPAQTREEYIEKSKSSWSPSKLRPRLSEKTLTRPLSDVQMSRCWSSVTDFDVESVALIAGRGSSGREAYVAGNLEEKWVFYRRKKFIKFEEDWTTRLGTSGRRNAEMKKCMCVLSRKWPKISSKRRQQDWLQRAPDSCWEDPRTFWAWDQEEAEAIALIGMTKTPGPTRRQG